MEQVEKTRTVCQLKMKKPTAVIACPEAGKCKGMRVQVKKSSKDANAKYLKLR